MGAGMTEPEEYIEILKEQLQEKNRLIQAFIKMVDEKNQALLIASATIKELEDK